MSQVDVTVYVKPNNNLEYSNIFDKIKLEFQTHEYSYEIFDDVMMFHYKIDISENRHKYEDFLDYLCTEYKKMRYIIKIYEPNKPYPESVRINKQLKKIKTKQQTKYLGF